MLIFVGTAFAVAAGVYALRTLPLDAIPDLSDVQVIVYTDYPGQAPQVVEDQVTYPLTTAMLTVPKSKVVRGFSFFGVSFVYVIFEDGTDPYWARSRVLEYLNAAAQPAADGRDAERSGRTRPASAGSTSMPSSPRNMTLAELRSLQDWMVRYAASKAEGVAEVASVGGFVKQYNDRRRSAPAARAGHLACRDRATPSAPATWTSAAARSRLSEFEFMVRGRGYLKSIADIENIVLKTDGGTPLRLERRRAGRARCPTSGAASPSSTAKARSRAASCCSAFGANALTVIDNVKAAPRRDRAQPARRAPRSCRSTTARN